ncbi:MAG: exonuclease domain-containing protein [Clostridia bacterium]|nr:exonuclease domain-containing protein [Clostridia bacterium]
MEYIILDLEWDNVYFPPEKRFVNQILQIGAVKLDESFNTVDTFNRIICSSISKKVTSRFAKLTGITTEIMRNGVPFSEALEEYNRFSENAAVTMTWSNSDLYTIVENEELLLKNKIKFKMNSYLDLQKLVQSRLYELGYESKNQISLEAAAEFLEVDTEEFELHNALDDCRVCAKLLKLCYQKEKFESLKRDTTQPDFYARLRFKAYPISNIKDSNIKPSALQFECPKCKGKTKRIKTWKYCNRWFIADFQCVDCGFKFNGRVSFKKTFDDLQVKHKVCEYKARKKNKNEKPNSEQPVQSVSEKV